MHAIPSPLAKPSADASNGLHLPSFDRTPDCEYWIHSFSLKKVKRRY
jgi:hypothetical protein